MTRGLVGAVLAVGIMFAVAPQASAATNVVPNGNFETAGKAGVPQGWSTVRIGRSTSTFTYPVAGDNGGSAAQITLRKAGLFSVIGGAYWEFAPISAIAGQTYTYTDNYKSDVSTLVLAEYTSTKGVETSATFGTAPASANAWATFSGQFKVPPGTASMTVYHYISSVGTLTIDNVSVVSGTTPPPPPPPPAPSITSFKANPVSILVGSSTILAWSVSNASSTSINQGVGLVSGSSISVTPPQTITYTLTATNPQGSVSTTTTVTVTQPLPPPPPPPAKPVITSFTATPSSITTGGASQLAWSVTGASSTSIDQGVGMVTGTSKTVSPIQTIKYTLTATNPGGSATSSVTVTVTTPPPPPAKPKIVSFVANPVSVIAGSSTVLSWNVTGASSTSIDQGVGVVTGASKTVTPPQTITYTITATNPGGSVSASTTVTVTPKVVPPPPPPTNLIPNGNLESGSTNNPTGWNADYWGTLTAKFVYPVTGKNGGKAAQVTVTKYSSGDAKWDFDHINVSSNTIYQFTDDYISNVVDNVSVEFLMQDGTYTYQWVANAPATGSAWGSLSAQITVPTGAVSMTVLHTLTGNGTLTIDNAVLTPITTLFPQGMLTFTFDDGLLSQYQNAKPIMDAAGFKGGFYIITTEPASGDSGYMTWAQITNLKNAGEEIGGHTRTHPYLTTLSASQLTSEVTGSYTDLVAKGFSPKTFVYPYGDVNPSVEAAVKSAGYNIARGSYWGLNTPSSDKLALYDMRLDQTTTLAQAQSEIDQAVANKAWLIFEIHDVVASGGDEYSITPTLFQQIVTYAKQKGIKVGTLEDGYSLMQ